MTDFGHSTDRAQFRLRPASAKGIFCSSISVVVRCPWATIHSPSICTRFTVFVGTSAATIGAFLLSSSAIGYPMVPASPCSPRIYPVSFMCSIGCVLDLSVGLSPCVFTPLLLGSGFPHVSMSCSGGGLSVVCALRHPVCLAFMHPVACSSRRFRFRSQRPWALE